MRSRFIAFAGALLAAALAGLPLPASAEGAEAFPSKPVRVIIPTPPGGGTDNIARPLSDLLYHELGQPFVIESRTGAGGAIALETLARAPKDGHTLLISVNAAVVALPHTRKLPVDTLNDLAPVALLTETISAVGIKPSLPVKTFQEFLDYCRAHPGEVHYGANAVGTTTYIRNEMLNRQARLGMVHVPYKGDSEIMTDLLAGVIDFAASSSVLPHTRNGQVRLLAFMADRRHPDYPDIPTVREIVPTFDAPTWYGMFAPAGTPEAVVAKLNAAVAKVLARPEVAKQLLSVGMVPKTEDVPAFQATVRRDHALYGKIIADLGVPSQ